MIHQSSIRVSYEMVNPSMRMYHPNTHNVRDVGLLMILWELVHIVFLPKSHGYGGASVCKSVLDVFMLMDCLQDLVMPEAFGHN